jgi:hypothetical protein
MTRFLLAVTSNESPAKLPVRAAENTGVIEIRPAIREI